MPSFFVKRVYEPPVPEDGARVLVDRLWPRGLKKEDAAIDLWAKNLAPSHELRRWFGHRPERWTEFRSRFRAELNSPEALEQLEALQALVGKIRITLLYAARDEEMNNAQVVREVLRERQ